jgi:hypothetical protein
MPGKIFIYFIMTRNRLGFFGFGINISVMLCSMPDQAASQAFDLFYKIFPFHATSS